MTNGLIWTLAQFLLCASIVLYAGVQLSRYGDCIAEKAGLGRTWIGLLLLATVTSLPELATSVSAATLHDVPNIAVGSVLGSCMFNVAIIAILDLISGSAPVSSKIHQGHVLGATLGSLLLALVGLDLVAGKWVPAIGWVDPFSLVFLLIYVAALRMVFLHEKNRLSEFVRQMAEEARYRHVSLRRACIMLVIAAVLITIAAGYLPDLGERIAAETGVGNTFVGSVFIAITTSLPEVVVSVEAARLGAFDMGVGNLFGSNLFNVAILGLADLCYVRGKLLTDASASQLLNVFSAVAMSAIAIAGLTYRTEKKKLPLAWDALGIVGVYGFATLLLLLSK